jgi:F-type H+-transporting ATPase subunit a
VGQRRPETLGIKDYMRVVATADLSTTLGLSTFVLLVCLYYNIKIKGLGGWGHELVSAPFGSHPVLWPFNFLMQIIEFIAKTVSHGMRLFGNMFAGELVFMLIALMGGYLALTTTGIGLAGHRPCHRRHHLDPVPHPRHRAAGLHLHDADADLHRPGA